MTESAPTRSRRLWLYAPLLLIIFLAAAFFLGVETALYSILTYIAASKTIDFILHGIEEYTAITIISTRSDEIKDAITGRLHRGVTVYKGSGGLGSTGESTTPAPKPNRLPTSSDRYAPSA